MPYVLSVNIGRPRPNPWKRLPATGIDKQPVSGRVAVTAPGPKGTGAVGLAGDRAYDVKHHGGDDQAVYAYAREDLDHWEGELGRTFAPGSFGENLTTCGLDLNAVLIGERWRIGTVLLEVSAPRIPCATFAGWLDEKGWMRTFTRAARPGPYLRVVEPGELAAGDDLVVEHRPQDRRVTVAECFRALTTEPELLPLLADLPALPAEDREAVRQRLARTGTPTAAEGPGGPS
ncbi:MOSC domain-containing protein [Actinacidiphila acidipaludis]|uniref:MOSC domain-containing protein n=1 Tax=Actinacidiphila acidipaludis TaxID=2873382 RepID=A0ABS7QIR4_9ACTN|nr:MOSC domain-containing protein [Streptomyces acidipaludis]MBY8881807.1 MOSC domain-containing protein [Streptomyces acidipaludis]